MALSNKRILEEMKKGNVVISPFEEDHLATSSYDVTLGEYFYAEQNPKHFQHIYNIYDKKQTEGVWGKKPLRAQAAKEIFKQYNFDFTGIEPHEKVIVLEPGETILAHTNEFIGGQNSVTTMMKARSSLGRNFIEVCKCAGWGDVGYINRWTMEITNNSKHYTIPLVVGRRIAQIVFFETGEVLKENKSYAKKGKYQSGQSLEQLKKSWKPDMMIPKLHKDPDIEKGKKQK